jgi:D-alanyl-D-alanine carboxypeptidase
MTGIFMLSGSRHGFFRIFAVHESGVMLFKRISLTLVVFLFLSVLSCRDHKKAKSLIVSADSLEMNRTEKAAVDSLLQSLTVFSHDDCFQGSSVGYVIYDITKGQHRLLAEKNASSLLVPASIQKLLTTAAALEIFGESIYREVTITNQMSINWRANRMMQKIGQEKYGKYDLNTGTKAVKEYWKGKGLDTTGIYLLDGSGRSHDNRITPMQIADVLYKMTLSSAFPVFFNSLPLAGLTGTMHKWLIGTVGQGRVRAKTGSLAGVRSYAGYVNTLNGHRLIFVFIVNDYSCSISKFKKKIEKVMIRMTEM